MADEYVELPEELIQHIQSFLGTKDVVRTSVLSKLWYNAWFTNPVLRLYESDFYRGRIHDIGRMKHEVYDFATRTMNRYLITNRKIYSFSLKLYGPISSTRLVDVDEWILSVLTQGVNDLQLKFNDADLLETYTLPDEVFSSIYLKKLCLDATGHIIYLHLPQSNGKSKVLCSQLVSLELTWVRLSDDMMTDILLGCPLMEDLRINSCFGLKKINLSVIRCNLRTFHARTWSGLFVEWDENIAPESTVSVQHQYHNLISLKLRGVKVDDLFFEFFPHRFPCLERLQLKSLKFEDSSVINMDIASNSLRYLSIKWLDELRFIKVHVPNIQNFTFRTGQLVQIPSLSFLTASEEWTSDLMFHHSLKMEDRGADVSWLKIRDIVTELSSSRISISIDLFSGDYLGSISEEIIQSNHISPFVENLTLVSWSCGQNSFGWLLCCRPKYITCTYKNLYKLLYNELKKHENKMISSESLPCIRGLEKVDMEHYEETLREWRPVRQETKQPVHEGGKFRLKLKWT